jgi:ribosome biogenesis GTPase
VVDLSDWGLTPRARSEFESLAQPDLVLARVVSSPGGRWRVVTERGEAVAEPSGRLRHEAEGAGDLPAVGDWLAVRPRPGEPKATVVATLPRASALVRRAAGRATEPQVIAANVDVVLVACGLDLDWNPARLARYVALAWESGARPVVLLTKADLVEDPAAAEAEARAAAPGAEVVVSSSVTGLGLQELRNRLPARETCAVVGSSGVGKSTLLNRLLGVEAQATTDVRESDGRGRHTTTTREMFRLPWGALLVDTPGLREVAAWTDAEAIAAAFEDVEALAGVCRFRDCAHGPEPGCAVRLAVDAGTLDADRLRDYRRLQRERAHYARQDDPLAMRAEHLRRRALGRAGREASRRKRGGAR